MTNPTPLHSSPSAPFDADRVLCSTITFRHLSLPQALRSATDLGFTGIDLGALPGVCDHVPFTLDAAAVRQVAGDIRASGVQVRSINGDVGDLNVPLAPSAAAGRATHLEHLLDLCAEVGATALVLPNGRQDPTPVATLAQDLERVVEQLTSIAARAGARGLQLWVEAPHYFRLLHNVDLAARLYADLPAEVGAVLDVSHVVASGSTPRKFLELFGQRTRHVHLRDAEPGYIHHSIGLGVVDFPDTIAALAEQGYQGAFALELETRDLSDGDRPAAARDAALYISDLLHAAS